MKFFHLAYENIGEQSKNINFGDKIAGCITVSDISGKPLADALSLALFGACGSYAGITLPAKVSLKFETKDERYTLIRLFETAENGMPSEQAVLSDYEETKIIAEGPEAIDAYLADKLTITKKAFDILFLMDRAAIADALTSDTTTRESYIASAVNGVTTLDEIIAKADALKSSEAELNKHIDSIEPVTRKAVKEQQTKAAADKVEVDTLQNDIAAIHASIAKAREYDEDTAKYYLELGTLEKLLAQKDEVEKNASFHSRCREAIAIKDIFTEYQAEQKKLEGLKSELTAQITAREALDAKIKEGEQSAKNLELKFVYHNEKTVELDKKMRELLAETAQTPDALKIDNLIDNYYASTQKQLQELESKQKALETEFQALQETCNALEARKADIRNDSDYKKAVEDGAVLEARLARINNEMTAISALIQKHEKDQLALYEQNNNQIDRIREFQLQYKELDAAIRKDKPSHKEAQDGIILYSQALYAKHIIASGYEAEIKALDKKIAKLQQTNDTFASKREVIATRKKELEAHVEKLEAKKELLTDKLTEYIGYNRLKEYSDAVEYGSHCPICDSFVTYKRDIPTKDTGLIQEQIEIVSAEIDKDRQGIAEAAGFIEQYDSNLTISSQYVAALQETKNQKQGAVDAILADFGVTSLQELYQKTQNAADEYGNFLRNLNDFHEVDAELRRLQENNAHVVESYNKLAKEVLPAAKEKYAVLNKELTETVAEYEKLQSVFNGENAEDLLLKLQILEKEYDAVETELQEKQAKLNQVRAQKDDNLMLLTKAQDKAVPLVYKESRYSYKQIIVKSVAETFNYILRQIDENNEQKEIAKTRLAGVRKLVAKYKEKLAELDQEITALKSKAEATGEVAENIFSHYKDRFAALGVATAEDLAALVLAPEDLVRREKEVADYREELIKRQKAVDDLFERININQVYYNDLDQNKKKLAELEERLQTAISEYVASHKKAEALTSRYNELIASNRKLSALQEKLRALEELSSAISEGAVIAKDFAKIVVERAGKKIQRWTSDKYTFELKEDGKISLVNNLKGKTVRPSKFNKEEKMLLLTGLATAFANALSDLLVTDLPQATVINIDETDKSGLGVLLQAAKEKDIIVLPEDDNMFSKAISKLV